ncbi:putative membrane-associated kinase regulator 6 [Acorus gramineus]|uniref:Membrane-associated kinase regulator 6 n=1 Tax=Acorus gramineus TaxID=55184 RepID=A0AAV9BID7_ACOGR|nr:putative membrane-associated kinase regulator 6 [Acorus gramineus]
MESLQHLSNESFSYSWLKNIKPSSIDTTEDSLRHSFYFDMDPKSSQPISSTTDFDFKLPNSQTLAHADQLFSNGLLLPFHPSPETTITMKEEDPSSSSSSSSHVMVVNNPKNSRRRSTVRPLPLPLPLDFRSLQRGSKAEDFSRNTRLKLPFFGIRSASSGGSSSSSYTCGSASKKMFRKYLCFFVPLYKKVKGLRLTSGQRTTSSMESSPMVGVVSIQSSPRMSDVDDVIDSSIYDAVLYCKKSSGKFFFFLDR